MKLSILKQAAEAKAKGLKSFDADRSCSRGHFKRDLYGNCVECRRLHWKKLPPVPLTEEQKIKRCEYSKTYRDNNPEKVRAAIRKWQKAHPAEMRIIFHRYYEKQKQANGD